MKLNKKVLVGALALSMGLGAVAPVATKSYADKVVPIKAEEDKEEYKTAAKAWLEAYKEAKTYKDKKADLETKRDKVYLEIRDIKEKVEEKAKIVEALKANKKAEEKTARETYVEGTKALQSELNRINAKYDDDITLKEGDHIEAKRELKNAELRESQIKRELTEKKYKAKQNKEEVAVNLADYVAYLQTGEKTAREAFKLAGGTEELMEEMIKSGEIAFPEEDKEVKEIKATIARMEEKLSALKAVKEYMPQSYKRYKKVIDEAVKSAEKSLKLANDYLAGLEK